MFSTNESPGCVSVIFPSTDTSDMQSNSSPSAVRISWLWEMSSPPGYITLDEVEVAGQKEQGKEKSFWQYRYKLMCGSIPEVVHTNTFDHPPERKSQNVQMSYSDIARGRETPVKTQTQNNTPDDASVDTTIASNLSCQDNTHMSRLSVVTGLSIMKMHIEEIDK
jgi:hypothetical protein